MLECRLSAVVNADAIAKSNTGLRVRENKTHATPYRDTYLRSCLAVSVAIILA